MIRSADSSSSSTRASPHADTGFSSVTAIRAPRPARKRAVARPVFPMPMTATFCFSSFMGFLSPQLQRADCHQRQQDGDDPEADDHLGFGPALELEMVVERGHPEDPFPVRYLEPADL